MTTQLAVIRCVPLLWMMYSRLMRFTDGHADQQAVRCQQVRLIAGPVASHTCPLHHFSSAFSAHDEAVERGSM